MMLIVYYSKYTTTNVKVSVAYFSLRVLKYTTWLARTCTARRLMPILTCATPAVQLFVH